MDPTRKVPVGATTYADTEQGEIELWTIDRVVLNPVTIPDRIQLQFPDVSVEEELLSPVARLENADFIVSPVRIPFALSVGESTLVCWADPYNTIAQKPLGFELVSSNDDYVTADIVDLGQTNDGTVNWNWLKLTSADTNLNFKPSVKIVSEEFNRTIIPIKLGTAEIIQAVTAMASGDDQPGNKDRILENIGVPQL